MTGDDLEKALSRYRIGGPPARLRTRILATATPSPADARPVWAAIWALAACTILFVGGASGVYRTLGRSAAEADDRGHAQLVAETADAIGGSTLGIEQATMTVVAAEVDAASVGAAGQAGIQ